MKLTLVFAFLMMFTQSKNIFKRDIPLGNCCLTVGSYILPITSDCNNLQEDDVIAFDIFDETPFVGIVESSGDQLVEARVVLAGGVAIVTRLSISEDTDSFPILGNILAILLQILNLGTVDATLSTCPN